ncbi:hypothetical protein [Chachezhania sediminis]|uniref:hypothetical protein n=1 Tax=Chachezhania sediminis TaxID=2599291 RepID=UPI00131D7D7E|nr:hypothetical protein [Chachezhania sediminis]
MARAIVHVGLPKTGSTSLQVFLMTHRDALAAQGFVYMPPRMSLHSQIEYAFIACNEVGEIVPDHIEAGIRNIQSVDDQRALTARFESELSAKLAEAPDATFLISCEQLGAYLRRPRQRAALDKWLRARFTSVVYLVFVRDMADFMLSVYSEAVKRGFTGNLDHFVAHASEIPMAKTAEDWATEFPGRVIVRMKPRSGASIYNVYADLVGMDISGLSLPKPHNRGFNAWEARAMRLVNLMFGPAEKRSKTARYWVLQARRVVRLFFGMGPKLKLSESQAALIQTRYPRDVRQIVDRLQFEGPMDFRDPDRGTATVANLADAPQSDSRGKSGRKSKATSL